ncbi:MAG: hypothetical protein ABI564_17260 [Ideonella sp.]
MTIARKLLAIAALGLGLGTSLAQAGNISWSIGVNLPPIGTVISNAPVYYPSAPYSTYSPYYEPAVVYRPAPVYYSPPPVVVYRSAPRYVGRSAYVIDRRGPSYRGWSPRGHDGYPGGHGGRRDRDRDCGGRGH